MFHSFPLKHYMLNFYLSLIIMSNLDVLRETLTLDPTMSIPKQTEKIIMNMKKNSLGIIVKNYY